MAFAAGQSRDGLYRQLWSEPPLTNDRLLRPLSDRCLAAWSAQQGGTTVKPDGSNINPVALALLNFKLPDGAFLIPTPQSVDPTKPFAQQGFSVFTDPCHFSEDQYVGNVDYLASPNSKFGARLFVANDAQTVTFPGNGLNPSGNISGFPSPGDTGFRVFSIAHTYNFHNAWLNDARIGYVRTRTDTQAKAAFSWSDVGVAEGKMSDNNELPSLKILGSVSIASGFPRTITQNSFVFQRYPQFRSWASAATFDSEAGSRACRTMSTLWDWDPWCSSLVGPISYWVTARPATAPNSAMSLPPSMTLA